MLWESWWWRDIGITVNITRIVFDNIRKTCNSVTWHTLSYKAYRKNFRLFDANHNLVLSPLCLYGGNLHDIGNLGVGKNFKRLIFVKHILLLGWYLIDWGAVLMSLIAQIKQIMHKFDKSLTSLSIQNGKFLPYWGKIAFQCLFIF